MSFNSNTLQTYCLCRRNRRTGTHKRISNNSISNWQDCLHQLRDMLPALETAKKLIVEHRVPVLVEIVLERVTNISMGTEIDNVVEFEELALSAKDAPTAVISMLD